MTTSTAGDNGDLTDDPELETLLGAIEASLTAPPDATTRRRHLATVAAATLAQPTVTPIGAARSVRLTRPGGRPIAAALATAAAAGAIGLAATGLLPPSVQRVAAQTAAVVGWDLPSPADFPTDVGGSNGAESVPPDTERPDPGSREAGAGSPTPRDGGVTPGPASPPSDERPSTDGPRPPATPAPEPPTTEVPPSGNSEARPRQEPVVPPAGSAPDTPALDRPGDVPGEDPPVDDRLVRAPLIGAPLVGDVPDNKDTEAMSDEVPTTELRLQGDTTGRVDPGASAPDTPGSGDRGSADPPRAEVP